MGQAERKKNEEGRDEVERTQRMRKRQGNRREKGSLL